MVLKRYHADLLTETNQKVGVDKEDPYKDTLYRNEIIRKMDYFAKTNEEEGAQNAYRWCSAEIDQRSKKIEDIIKETKSQIAENEIMLRTLKDDPDNENIYKSAVKAYEVFIVFLSEGEHNDVS